jgi:hypothetical protein
MQWQQRTQTLLALELKLEGGSGPDLPLAALQSLACKTHPGLVKELRDALTDFQKLQSSVGCLLAGININVNPTLERASPLPLSSLGDCADTFRSGTTSFVGSVGSVVREGSLGQAGGDEAQRLQELTKLLGAKVCAYINSLFCITYGSDGEVNMV